MAGATDQLIKDHKMVRKIFSDFSIDNPRFPDLLKTLQRVVLGHAWFEDTFLLPALRAQPLVFQPFWQEIAQEHEDISALMTHLRTLAHPRSDEGEFGVRTLKTLMESHFMKEEDALFPIAERVIREEGLRQMAEEMERRKAEVHKVLPIS